MWCDSHAYNQSRNLTLILVAMNITREVKMPSAMGKPQWRIMGGGGEARSFSSIFAR